MADSTKKADATRLPAYILREHQSYYRIIMLLKCGTMGQDQVSEGMEWQET